MRLLVSVANPEEARAAVDGGADIIDAKDPAQGALGAVAPGTLEAIVQAVGGARPVSAAVGDARGAGSESDRARALLALIAVASGGPGLAFIKMGFDRGLGRLRAMAHAAAAVDAASTTSCSVVLAGYADAGGDHLSCEAVIEIAVRCGAVGVLIDTLEKRGANSGPATGLFATVTPAVVAHWVNAAHEGGLSIALAGSLGVAEVEWVRELGADIMGVRGSVCDGGRVGRVSAVRVRELAARVDGMRRGGPDRVRPAMTADRGAAVAPRE